ncbi:MAG: pentapeptide repeat-containing protein [Bacteroidales bacterium]|nr:pentapeptide repeat-containing protein [Candidatus Latescibacterota bacterium]
MKKNQRMGRVYTFYSYKGGVGRSMTMVNVAALLAKWGHKVLIVDWDLEAPGLEIFFNRTPVSMNGDPARIPGVVDLLLSRTGAQKLDWRDCVIEIDILGSSLDIITAGKRDDDYRAKLLSLDWPRLFEEHSIGNYLNDIRNEWIGEYDFVLIDSRTGINDIGDICTVILPDVLILLFVTNRQNIDGIKRVMARARKVQSQLPVNRSKLVGVPVPSRDEVYNEYDRSQEWKNIFAEEMSEYYRNWLPRGVEPREALNKLFIPYVANWSFGERLPVVENESEIHNPTSISAAYGRLARLIEKDLDWTALVATSDPNEIDKVRQDAVSAKDETKKVKRRTRWIAAASIPIVIVAIIAIMTWVNSYMDIQNFEERLEQARVLIDAEAGVRVSSARRTALEFLMVNGKSLQEVNLESADLSGMTFVDANLTGANLRNADLSDASLRRANLRRADLTGANLRNADLTAAIFAGAKLGDTNFDNALLIGARIDSVRNLDPTSLINARELDRAVLNERTSSYFRDNRQRSK